MNKIDRNSAEDMIGFCEKQSEFVEMALEGDPAAEFLLDLSTFCGAVTVALLGTQKSGDWVHLVILLAFLAGWAVSRHKGKKMEAEFKEDLLETSKVWLESTRSVAEAHIVEFEDHQ